MQGSPPPVGWTVRASVVRESIRGKAPRGDTKVILASNYLGGESAGKADCERHPNGSASRFCSIQSE